MKNWIRKTVTMTKWGYLSVLFVGVLTTSCEFAENIAPVVEFVEDIAEIHEGLEDAMAVSEDALTITLADGSTGYLVGECAVVTNNEVDNILTIDMGSTGCTGLNGLQRSGKMIINYLDEEDPEAYSSALSLLIT